MLQLLLLLLDEIFYLHVDSRFFAIVTNLSPQLGGHARDLEIYANSLKISDGKPVLDYYTRALRMFHKIELQQDATGQQN